MRAKPNIVIVMTDQQRADVCAREVNAAHATLKFVCAFANRVSIPP